MAESARLIPDCRVSVGGTKLDLNVDARLTRVTVDLDGDLFGKCTLVLNDPHLTLINGTQFASGAAVKVELGFAARFVKVFEGEVVALEPQFRRDMPVSLHVVCLESIHRLALSSMTRSFNDVDDKEIANKIAQEHGLTASAPSGSKEHVLQANVSDAVFLRKLAQKHSHTLRIVGKKLIIGPPPKGGDVAIAPGDGLIKLRVKLSALAQVGEVTVHGWDPKTKKEIIGKAKPEGETGEGARAFGKSRSIAIAGHEQTPVDIASAESMAKGRLRKISEGFVVAHGQMIGDPRVVPGAILNLDKIGVKIDGGYRVDQALHEFSRHGYWIKFKGTRVTKKSTSANAADKAQKHSARALQAAEEANLKKVERPAPKPDKAAQAQAQAMKDAAKSGAPLAEVCAEPSSRASAA